MMKQDVFILSAARTPIGTFGGALKDATPPALAALVTREAIARAAVSAESVGHVVFGQVIPTEPRDAYVARIAAIEGGLPKSTPALTVNRLCGSGMQAVLSAAQTIMLGDAEVAVGGGAEVMSRSPSYIPALRWGLKMGDGVIVDGLNGALTDPFGNGLMGVTAENIAARHDISRAQQDAYSLESHRRAATAIAEGRFKSQIVGVDIKIKGKPARFEVDEHVRPEAKLEDFERLRPIFKSENGTVTAGNASGVNDGAAALVLASKRIVEEQRLRPLARIVSYGYAGVDPAFMGIGPVPASRVALGRAGLTVADLAVIESNEAFAAQACAVAKELGFDPARVNPNGSGISLGHPVGATGAIILTKLIYELRRIGGRFGLATMCIGGGQGIAMIVESLPS